MRAVCTPKITRIAWSACYSGCHGRAPLWRLTEARGGSQVFAAAHRLDCKAVGMPHGRARQQVVRQAQALLDQDSLFTSIPVGRR